MQEDPRPQINASKIVFGGGIAGLIFTVGSMLIFLAGLPVLRYMFPCAIVLGCVVALVLRFARHDTPGKPWLLPGTESQTRPSPRPAADGDQERGLKVVALAIGAHV